MEELKLDPETTVLAQGISFLCVHSQFILDKFLCAFNALIRDFKPLLKIDLKSIIITSQSLRKISTISRITLLLLFPRFARNLLIIVYRLFC